MVFPLFTSNNEKSCTLSPILEPDLACTETKSVVGREKQCSFSYYELFCAIYKLSLIIKLPFFLPIGIFHTQSIVVSA